MKRGIFCVKDNYRSEISQVRVGDQFVIVIPRDGEKKKIAGLYEVIDDERLCRTHVLNTVRAF
jgi:hypothetical protein